MSQKKEADILLLFREINMKEKYLVLLLQLVKADGSVEALLKNGLEYSQIANLILQVKQDSYIAEKEGRLELTDLGLEKLKELSKKANRKNIDTWISPSYENRIDKSEKLNVFDIYIPNRKELKL